MSLLDTISNNMYDKLKNLLDNSIVLKFTLPNQEINISKTCISTLKDYCYYNNDIDALSRLIYNGIIEYCYGANKYYDTEISIAQRNAIKRKLRFDENKSETNQKKYGFYGEILLDLILKTHFSTNAIIARGQFYDLLSGSEIKGYDSLHFIVDGNIREFWFGEVKFFENFSDAFKSVFKNINKALSAKYLGKNLMAIIDKYENKYENEIFRNIYEEFESEPSEEFLFKKINELGFKIIYPIFIIYQFNKNKVYNHVINDAILHINNKINDSNSTIFNEINAEIFFCFLPISDVNKVKKDVILWMLEKKQLNW